MTELRAIFTWLHDQREWVFSGCGLLVLSLLGAGIRHIWTGRRNSGTLRITLSSGFLTYGSELSDVMLFFTVANAGESTAYISGIKIPVGKHGTMFFPYMRGEGTIPCPIRPGTSLRFWTELEDVKATLREKSLTGKRSIQAVLTDGTDVEYRSKSLTLTL